MNKLSMKVLALSKNEAFARSAIAAFCVELNPTLEQVNDIKTAVSEAVTNCVVHAYTNNKDAENYIDINVEINDGKIDIEIKDYGVGIKNIEEAKQPFFTTKHEQERSGMGFTIMSSFMSDVKVISEVGKGTTVKMSKIIGV